MDADFVVDVGNSRIKWGRCGPCGVIERGFLPLEPVEAWQNQYENGRWPEGARWILTGVNPAFRNAFSVWLQNRRQKTFVLDSARQLPLVVRLDQPDQVGIDRLLNAVAANRRRGKGRPAVVVDAGSAVTVDWLDQEGAFCGGAIFPGLELMARALNNYTALLPLVEISSSDPALPGVNTRSAIQAGVFWSVVGGINTLVRQLANRGQEQPSVFLAGGAAPLFVPYLDSKPILWPEITLEGIRLAAEKIG